MTAPAPPRSVERQARGRMGRAGWSVVVVAVLLTLVGIITVVAAQRGSVEHPTTDERSAVQQAAADSVTAVMTFAPADAPVRAEVLSGLTGRLSAEYRTQGPDVILPNAVDSRTTMSAKVIGAAVAEYSTDDAKVLVFVDQQISVPGFTAASGIGGERIAISRWAMMHRVDGAWRLSDLRTVDADR